MELVVCSGTPYHILQEYGLQKGGSLQKRGFLTRLFFSEMALLQY